MIATSATIGAVAGTLIVGKVSDVAGRRKAIMIGAGFSLVGSCACAMANTVTSLVVGRFMSGVAFGFYSTAVNIHLAECASPSSRGTWLTIPQFVGRMMMSYLRHALKHSLLCPNSRLGSPLPLSVCLSVSLCPSFSLFFPLSLSLFISLSLSLSVYLSFFFPAFLFLSRISISIS